jgi:hypothetical protein
VHKCASSSSGTLVDDTRNDLGAADADADGARAHAISSSLAGECAAINWRQYNTDARSA